MADYVLTSPDGKQKYKITAPDDASEQQVMTYFQSQLASGAAVPETAPEAAPEAPAPAPQPAPPTPGASPLMAAADAGMNILSSAVAAPVSGIAGLLSGGNADVVESVGSALTYQPRTAEGQQIAGVVSYPFEKLAQFGDYAGGAVAEATGSPALGAGLNTLIQAAPAALLRGKGKAPAPQARIAPTVPGKPTIPPQEAAARQYVARNTGLDWNSLSGQVKAKLTEIAGDATALSRLDPRAVERQARLQSLPVPVPATKGQLTRDPVQLRNEGNVAATEAGKPIRDIHVAANRALLDNLERLKSRQGGKAASPEQVGQSVQGAARANLKDQKSEVSRLYKEAETAGEMQGTAPTRNLNRLLDESPDRSHLGYVESWLKKAELAKGQGRNNLTLKEFEDLRQAAVAKAMNGGTDGYYAGKVIKAIDDATEGVGGSAYKAARAARKKQAMEFDEQAGVNRLVDNKSRTDRAVALEDTWRKTVLGGSIQDLRAVQKNLLTGKNSVQGKQAWRDLRAETIQHIINEATKSVARFEDGTPNITPAAMDRAIKSVGKDKMEVLFGKATVRSVDNIMEATRTIKTEPPPIHKGSSTVSNVLALLERGLSAVPVLGNVAQGVIVGGKKLREMGKASREVKEAQKGPLDVRVKKRNALTGRNQNALRNLAPYETTALDDY